MRKKFFTNLIFLVLINLLVKPFYLFGIDRTVQNVVGTETFGLYFSIFNFAYLFQILLDFGIQFYNNKNIAQHNQLLSKLFPNIIIAKLLLSVGYVIVTFASALIVGFSDLQMKLLIFLIFNQILISLIMYLRSNISALYLFKTDSFISILDKLVMIVIMSFLLWFLPISKNFQIEWFVYAQTASFLVTLLACLLVLNKYLFNLQFRISRPFLILIFRESYPYAIAIFLMAIYSRIDGVMIERLLGTAGAEEAGIYAAAYRILDAVNMFGFMFASLLLPIFARMIKQKEDLSGIVISSFKAIFLGGLIIAINSWFYRNEIMDLLYHHFDPYYGQVFGILILTFLAVGSMYIFGTLLTANGNLWQMNFIFIICVLLNIVMNYFLILEYKAYGAAVATLITQSLVVIGEIYLVRNIFRISLNLNLILKIIAFAIVLLALNYLATFFDMHWIIKFLILISLSGLAVIPFGIPDLKLLLKRS